MDSGMLLVGIGMQVDGRIGGRMGMSSADQVGEIRSIDQVGEM